MFSHSLTAWLLPGDSQCGRKFTNNPTEDVLFYEDATLNENGDAHVSWHCAGIRTSTACTMLNLKSFIIFSVDLLSRGGVLKLSQVPPQIVLFGHTFNLYGATLWNGGHYICTFYFNNGWFLYDGLREHTKRLWSCLLFRTLNRTTRIFIKLSYLL